jgi:hypothetical protein
MENNMTIDLNEHMEQKKQERHIAAYDAIGEAVDGMTVGTILHILSVFSATVLDQLDEPERSKAAMVFSSVIMESKTQPESPVQ